MHSARHCAAERVASRRSSGSSASEGLGSTRAAFLATYDRDVYPDARTGPLVAFDAQSVFLSVEELDLGVDVGVDSATGNEVSGF